MDTSWSDLACDLDTVRMPYVCTLDGPVAPRPGVALIPTLAGTPSSSATALPCNAGNDPPPPLAPPSSLMAGGPVTCDSGNRSTPAASPGLSAGAPAAGSEGGGGSSGHHALTLAVALGVAGGACLTALGLVAFWWRRQRQQLQPPEQTLAKRTDISSGELDYNRMVHGSSHVGPPHSPACLKPPSVPSTPRCAEVAGGQRGCFEAKMGVQPSEMPGSTSTESRVTSVPLWSTSTDSAGHTPRATTNTSTDSAGHTPHAATSGLLLLSTVGSEAGLLATNLGNLPFGVELGVDVVVGEGRPIGRGGTYLVYTGVFRSQEVAVKVLYTNTQEGKQGKLQRWVGGHSLVHGMSHMARHTWRVTHGMSHMSHMTHGMSHRHVTQACHTGVSHMACHDTLVTLNS